MTSSEIAADPPIEIPFVRPLRTGDEVERRFLEEHAALYLSLADLATVASRIEARRDWEASKEQGALLDEDAMAMGLSGPVQASIGEAIRMVESLIAEALANEHGSETVGTARAPSGARGTTQTEGG